MSLKFYVDKAGNRVYVQSAKYFEVDVFGNITLLFPASVAITADIAESQTKQTEAIVAKETYNAALSESQTKQTEAIISVETYRAALSETQTVQAESIAAKNYSISIAESQVKQTESISASEAYLSSIAETQTIQTEAIDGTVTAAGAISADIAEVQGLQTETIDGTVAGPVSADIVETQARQTESITGTTPIVPPIVIGRVSAGNGRSSNFTHRKAKPYPTLREKKRILEVKRQEIVEEEETEEERQEAIRRLQRLLWPSAPVSIQRHPQAIAQAAKALHEAETKAREIHARREKEIEELLLTD